MTEHHEIFVRAHTVIPPKWHGNRPWVPPWPERVLVFDCETTLDTSQTLTIGAYRICELRGAGYLSIEEGLFYGDGLNAQQRKVLERYVSDPRNVPKIGVKRFPPQTKLKLYSRAEFVERVFWRQVRQGAMVVGFNLPFDLSRLAVKSTSADTGGWSFILSLRQSQKTGEIEPNPERPRLVITSINSKMAFFSLSSIRHPEEWPREGRFLDLRTLGWALRNRSYGLDTWCEKYKLPGKLTHKLTGNATVGEIDYCREDVRATADLLNAMKREFDQHPLEDFRPDQAYSPASIAKAYLGEMQIDLPTAKFEVPDSELGIAMQAYFGGRAEIRIRKTPVPVVLTDFTSQYPTVNALLGNWDVLTANAVRFKDCTKEARKLLRGVKHTFNPTFWRKLSFFALVLPDQDILPVRTVYNGRTQNIGLNHLTSKQPIWFAGPDLVASCLQTGKAPRIIQAIRMVPRGRQAGLARTNLAGLVRVNPKSDNFFCRVIEQKSAHKPTNKPLADFLKVLGNSGSYGLFVEVNQEKVRKPANVKIYSGEIFHESSYSTVEKQGHWYFPLLASLITAGGRLLLAMLEKSVTELKGSHLFCDTDSLCIVSNKRGGLIPCPGGPHKLGDGREAVKALSWKQVKAIADRFKKLNPYDDSLVRDILKIEDINFVDFDPRKPQRQVYGYAISAKRYVLYGQEGKEISILKASGHGLGYLCAPIAKGDKDKEDEEEEETPKWMVEAWEWLLRKELGLPCKEPAWLDLPAMMRMTLTSPNIMRESRPEWLKPFNFFLLPILSDLGGHPAGCNRTNFRFITPFNSNPKEWSKLKGINLFDGQECRIAVMPNAKQDKVVPESFRIILRLYLRHPESKSLAPDGNPCTGDTQGLLKRASILAGEIVPVGKETDRRWEQGEDMSMVDFKVLEYRESNGMVVADQATRNEIRRLGMRESIRRFRISQHTLEAIRDGKPVRRKTLQRVRVGLGLG